MKEMDSLGLKICSYQAKIFEKSLEQTKCSTKIFIRRFMNSELAKRMDKNGIMFESLDIIDAIDEIEEEYGGSSYGKEKYSIEEMHWIGYIYRYWAYVTNKSSKQIYKMMKPEKIKQLYFPYHSLDPLQVIDRIMEDMPLEDRLENTDITRGVIILRRVRNNSNN